MTQANNTLDLPEQLKIRRDKRAKLLESGVEAYPVEVDRTISISDLRKQFVVNKPSDDDAASAASKVPEGARVLEVGEERISSSAMPSLH